MVWCFSKSRVGHNSVNTLYSSLITKAALAYIIAHMMKNHVRVDSHFRGSNQLEVLGNRIMVAGAC